MYSLWMVVALAASADFDSHCGFQERTRGHGEFWPITVYRFATQSYRVKMPSSDR